MVRSNTRRLLPVISVLSLAAVTLVLAIRYMRRNPSAYSCREGSFEIPRPFLTRDELREILVPGPGENLLEVGPGKGFYSFDVAGQVSSDGNLTILDVQEEMLEHTMGEARKRGVSNITATRADAADLPYLDNSFDGAYLVAVLGEVPDRRGSVRELKRVVRPGGRIVVGEAITDPHRVLSGELKSLTKAVGLRFDRKDGGFLGTFYRFIA